MRKVILSSICLMLIIAYGTELFAAVFYTPKEYNTIYNEKVAAELEVKVLKRQLKNEKKRFKNRENFHQHVVKDLDKQIALLEKKLEEEKKIARMKINALQKRSNILKKKGSKREKQLVDEITDLQKRYEKQIDDIKAKLDKEREENIEQAKKSRDGYESKIESLNSKIENFKEELSNLKELTKNQERELSRMESQAKDLEKRLKSEIEQGQIRLKRFHDKLIINLDDKISFASGSSSLKKGILPALDKVKNILAKYPENMIVVEGHTDNIPIRSKRFRNNWQLSTERALSVLGYLLKQKKLNPIRFSAAGFGEHHPIVPNDTRANRALNRRVDIVVRPRVKKK